MQKTVCWHFANLYALDFLVVFWCKTKSFHNLSKTWKLSRQWKCILLQNFFVILVLKRVLIQISDCLTSCCRLRKVDQVAHRWNLSLIDDKCIRNPNRNWKCLHLAKRVEIDWHHLEHLQIFQLWPRYLLVLKRIKIWNFSYRIFRPISQPNSWPFFWPSF